MFAARRLTLSCARINVTNGSVKAPSNTVRLFMQESGQTGQRVSHAARRKGLKEMANAPSQGTAFNIGQGALAGASVLGIGALAFYGLGLSNKEGAADKAMLWPEHVRQRVRDTYGYFGASIGITAASAAAVFRTPALLNVVASGGLISLGVSIAAMIGTGMIARSIPYEEGFGKKQLAWMAHCAVMGTVLAPICFLGGPILYRAAWYTAGMVGGLSTVAVTAPSDKFLYMGGPLAMGFGVIFMSSIASNFLPPTTALGAGVYSLALYGGLILFGGFILYDTQKIIHRAENHPNWGYGVTKFDPINNSIGIYADTLNIFIRIAQILAMQGGRRK